MKPDGPRVGFRRSGHRQRENGLPWVLVVGCRLLSGETGSSSGGVGRPLLWNSEVGSGSQYKTIHSAIHQCEVAGTADG
ncbi:hypothetical protein DPMN_160743 [Dreissena polymorpha]|uniref:Uncharacterized protein n=1 Tax=Dreissena polymorpha TaxID=45954 RepID=A0A9D4ISU5_DREPO|nr:hypothetical protein DPMN_160743 [Dreissena polymorpha]